MLFRFSLYGFLKNQQYFGPFLLLALLEKGLSFTEIGLLIGFREICINLMEIPTGAIADVVGRRRGMILSFAAYIVSFAVFGYAESVWALVAAMFLFSVGETFRSGTHKAIIFDWLAREGREGEKTKIYGLTRSWSKRGSAVSVLIAASLVFATGRFSTVFLYSIIPYAFNIVNFLGYPAHLDGPHRGRASVAGILRTLYVAFRDSISSARLRRLLVESMCFEGAHKICMDYLQMIVKAAALALPIMAIYTDAQRTAVIAAPVFLTLYLLGSWASRRSHALVDLAGTDDRSAAVLWWAYLAVFVFIAAFSGLGAPWMAIPAFVILSMVQNFWRPMQIGRFMDGAKPARHATILSMESQSKSLFAAVLAPVLGLAVDHMPADMRFLPVGLVGVLTAVTIIATSRRATGKTAASR